jgi:hypothetical protein
MLKATRGDKKKEMAISFKTTFSIVILAIRKQYI